MIPRKYEKYVMPFFMALFMSFFMSGIMTLVNTGIDSQFIFRWLRAFGIGFIVAYPTAFLLFPVARFLKDKVVSDQE